MEARSITRDLRPAGFLALLFFGLLAVAAPPAIAKGGSIPYILLRLSTGTVGVFLLAWSGFLLGRPLGLPGKSGRSGLVGSAAMGALLGAFVLLLIAPRTSAPLRGAPVLVFLKGLYLAGYAGILEETAFRLFGMSLLARGLWPLSGRATPPPDWIFAASALLSGIAFGVAHLIPLSEAALSIPLHFAVRTVVLNLLVSFVFAWLFWRRSLAHAITAHIALDVALYALWPLRGILGG